jgi:hypothetical protein
MVGFRGDSVELHKYDTRFSAIVTYLRQMADVFLLSLHFS